MKYVHTHLHGKGSMTNDKGYQVYEVASKQGKIKFIEKFGIGVVIEMKPKKFRSIDKRKLHEYVKGIVEEYNKQGNMMIFSNSKKVITD